MEGNGEGAPRRGGGMQVQGRKDHKGMKRYGQMVSVEQRALDQWTQRVLKDQYDQTLEEPLPEDLLALVRQFPEQH
ncbi:hypothetical protein ACFQU7_10505 [Pseudoroseomonas wenyumeiae]